MSREVRISWCTHGKPESNSRPHLSMRTHNWKQNLPKDPSDVVLYNTTKRFVSFAEAGSICNGLHILDKWLRFQSAGMSERWTLIKEAGARLFCVRFGHFPAQWPVSEPCSGFNYRRNRRLLYDAGKQFSGRNMAETERKKNNNHCIADTRLIDWSFGHFSTN